jgi:hypothetical protein
MASTAMSFEAFKSQVLLKTKESIALDDLAASQPLHSHRDSDGRKTSSSDNLYSGRVPLDRRDVPERYKFTPKEKEDPSSKKPVAPASEWIIHHLATATTKNFIRLLPNDGGSHERPGVKILVPSQLDKLLEIAVVKLELHHAATRAFTKDGVALTCDADLNDLPNNSAIFIAVKKDPFMTAEIAARKVEALRTPAKSVLRPSTANDALSPAHGLPPALRSGYRLVYNTPFQKRHSQHMFPFKSISSVRLHCGLGTMSLRNIGLTSLEGMGVHSEMTECYLQHNNLVDLEYFETQPRLKELSLQDNRIVSFKGFAPQPRIEHVFFEGNPITQHPNYILMLYILLGHPGVKIDGQGVDKAVRSKGTALSSLVARALRQGFLLENEPVAGADIDLSIEEYATFREQEINGLVTMSNSNSGQGSAVPPSAFQSTPRKVNQQQFLLQQRQQQQEQQQQQQQQQQQPSQQQQRQQQEQSSNQHSINHQSPAAAILPSPDVASSPAQSRSFASPVPDIAETNRKLAAALEANRTLENQVLLKDQEIAYLRNQMIAADSVKGDSK